MVCSNNPGQHSRPYPIVYRVKYCNVQGVVAVDRQAISPSRDRIRTIQHPSLLMMMKDEGYSLSLNATAEEETGDSKQWQGHVRNAAV